MDDREYSNFAKTGDPEWKNEQALFIFLGLIILERE